MEASSAEITHWINVLYQSANVSVFYCFRWWNAPTCPPTPWTGRPRPPPGGPRATPRRPTEAAAGCQPRHLSHSVSFLAEPTNQRTRHQTPDNTVSSRHDSRPIHYQTPSGRTTRPWRKRYSQLVYTQLNTVKKCWLNHEFI